MIKCDKISVTKFKDGTSAKMFTIMNIPKSRRNLLLKMLYIGIFEYSA